MLRWRLLTDWVKKHHEMIHDLLVGFGITVALVFIYVPHWVFNRSLFDEMSSIARDSEDVRRSLYNTPGFLDQ
jgi:hypothetical protein